MAAKSMQCNEAERQRILDAAVTLFADSGYAGATMGRIAVSAGCSVGHLYSHFSSKQSLLEELTTRFFRRLNQALDAVEAAPMRSPLSRYRMRLQALARELGRDHRLVAVVLGEEAMLQSCDFLPSPALWPVATWPSCASAVRRSWGPRWMRANCPPWIPGCCSRPWRG